MEKKLEVKNLKISFRTDNGKVQAVRDISFDLFEGETLAIVGESGSGKSVTSRAIMGILAGNSICEGGEILYNGQDLMKIAEEDFHKLRGDKIAMIFQDPMSSLNPIMKVGKQLTEAMFLKGRSSQRRARREFNYKLSLLRACMDEAAGTPSKEHVELCKTFDSFCIVGTKLEEEYNSALRHINEVSPVIKEAVDWHEKGITFDMAQRIADILRGFAGIENAFLINGEHLEYADKLREAAITLKGDNAALSAAAVPLLKGIDDLLDDALQKPKPNFFTLGYYMMRNPDFDVKSTSVEELNKLTRNFIDENFMKSFIEKEKQGLRFSFDKALAAKKETLALIDKALEYFNGETLTKENCACYRKELFDVVKRSIDPLSVRKDSVAYTFPTSFNAAVKAYFDGVSKNPKEQARFDKQQAKRDKLIEKGKTPDWEVIPAAIIDLDNARSNIRLVLHRLADDYKEFAANAANRDDEAEAIAFIDHLKEQASAVTYTITRRLAKVRALKLLEEVGIDQPRIRYNQYPFEFSGGMRQRIVIAIALAANPDILICDEPTTALDVTIQSQILELINRIKKERSLSVIFITHDLGVVANMADRIAVMYAGKIVEYGTADDIFYDPRHPYTWALLSSMPDLDTKEKLEAIPGTPPNMIYPPKGDAFAARSKYAMEIDFEQEPPMFEVSETHYAATWLLHPSAPKVSLPKVVTDRIERMTAQEVEQDG